MSAQSKRVLSDALDLSPIERAELVEGILASFDFPSRREVDDAWAKESEDRIDAYERGELKAKPVDQIFDDIDKQQAP